MSFGSAIGAIVSLRNNRRDSKRKHGDLPGESSESTGVKSHRTPSKKELDEIKNRLQTAHKKRQRKIILISATCFIIFCTAFYFIMF